MSIRGSIKMLSGVLAVVTRRPRREETEEEARARKAACPPQELMPDWGVRPYQALEMDETGCELVKSIRFGNDGLRDIGFLIVKILGLLSEFSREDKTAQEELLWILLQDACCCGKFRASTLWKAYCIGRPIPE